MTEQSKNQPVFNIGQVGIINTGDVTIEGDQVGIQNNQPVDPELKEAIAQLQSTLQTLATNHPDITTEEGAIALIDAEFTEIQNNSNHPFATLRQQLLSPKQHLNALKAAITEMAKNWQENSIWGKGAIVY